MKEFLIKCSTSWPYLISEFLVAYITIVASDWPHIFFTPKVFLFSICTTSVLRMNSHDPLSILRAYYKRTTHVHNFSYEFVQCTTLSLASGLSLKQLDRP